MTRLSLAAATVGLAAFAARAQETRIAKSDVPAAVMATVEQKYPGAKQTGL